MDLQGGPGERINEGRTLKFADLARLEFAGGGTCLSLYRSAPVTLPFRILQVERHP
ncbi:MAG: ureidoglycolate lyase, partial [Xanthomonadales bacterium]|nr:ureidoglycolate lyase [Xanthomonadales bacterium]NIX11692.1 ureidoglycolate lyase [Xanthomonadales bacterium]